jgi:hypothetical protein
VTIEYLESAGNLARPGIVTGPGGSGDGHRQARRRSFDLHNPPGHQHAVGLFQYQHVADRNGIGCPRAHYGQRPSCPGGFTGARSCIHPVGINPVDVVGHRVGGHKHRPVPETEPDGGHDREGQTDRTECNRQEPNQPTERARAPAIDRPAGPKFGALHGRPIGR